MPRFARMQPKPMGSSSTGSYSLITASATSTRPTKIIRALPQVKLVKPRVTCSASREKSMPVSSVGVLEQKLSAFHLVAGRYADCGNGARPVGADDVFHLH